MNYNIELKHQEKDNQLTISIHVEDLPINCLKNLEYIKEDAEKAVTSYLDLLRGEKVSHEKSPDISEAFQKEQEIFKDIVFLRKRFNYTPFAFIWQIYQLSI